MAELMVEITRDNAQRMLIEESHTRPVLIDFWAGWCQPCLMMAPHFEAATAALEPAVRLAKIDTEAERGLASRFGIRSIPTMILLHRGREIARHSGAIQTPQIVAWVRQHLP